MPAWSPSSWSNYTYQQTVNYPNKTALNRVVEQLSLLPPLVTPAEIIQLKNAIARAGRGEAFILQGGDCAESFQDCRLEIVSNKLKILHEMSQALLLCMKKPIVCVGRIAGQYAKPRSSDDETINGITLPSYRGDLINSPAFNALARKPNPDLLLQGYHCASKTLAFIRSQRTPADFFTSHEALHLHYEQALTRYDHHQGHWYNLSTHLPWVGIRTAHLNSAHLELMRGIENPIGIKVGPHATSAWITALLEQLNPKREEGRIFLISRMGSKKISTHLPPLIKAVQALKIPVTWSCDPMHGNTEIMDNGVKTRHFDTILSEMQQAVQIHQALDSHLGGVHFELTGENVTECIGGAGGLTSTDLNHAYHSLVDPRLNYEQSLEMAVQLSLQFSP